MLVDIGQFSSPVIPSEPFATLSQAAQVLVQVSAIVFVLEDILIDPFMADLDLALTLQPARDLFGAPLLPEQGFYLEPQARRDAIDRFAPSFQCPGVGTQRPIASITYIAGNLTAHRGLVDQDHSCDFFVGMT